MRRSPWNRIFVASSFGLGLLFVLFLWQELTPEWQGYQSEYYQRLATVMSDPSRARMPLKVLQIYLPELHRTDRCITCHTGIDNPKMKDQPQPFRSHPDLGIPGFLSKHSFTEMGCTICHQGQGPATVKEHAHGHVAHWEEPLLPKGLTISTCATCHGNVLGLKGTEPLVQAKMMFDSKGCIGCHALNGVGNQIGPELSETGLKSLDEMDFRRIKKDKTVHNWIYEHFKNPQAVVPGDPALGIPETPMPNYELTDEEAMMLTALVLSYANAKGKEGQAIPAKFKVAVAATSPQPEPVFSSKVEQGRYIFQKVGCIACHGVEGRGGVRNKNMDLGEEVPPLVGVSEGFTREELKTTIRNGRTPARADSSGLAPPLWMPAWKDKLTEEEIDAVVEYLLSLHS